MSTGNCKLSTLVSRILRGRCTWIMCWRGGILLAALAAAMLLPSQVAHASTFKVLHSFCSKANCADGEDSSAGLIIDGVGNLYGTTHAGGLTTCSGGCGVVFKLVPNARKTKWAEKVLHRFCSMANCADGYDPAWHMIVDGSGNLFGTTYSGGRYGAGTVFELVLDSSSGAYSEKVLYNFCPLGTGHCKDGKGPQGGVIADEAGNLYGATKYGGGSNSGGTVFELVLDSGTGTYFEKVLYSFCALANCADGANLPNYPIMDSFGNLYGVTLAGGVNGQGTVFELVPNVNKIKWREKVLYSFCPTANCADGMTPGSPLMIDNSGNVYGTTEVGGLHNCSNSSGCGVAFELIPNASKTRWKYKLIYTFCRFPDVNGVTCADGAGPRAALAMDAGGGLLGITEYGNQFSGTLFTLTPNARKTKWVETTLHGFCPSGPASPCPNGLNPYAAPIKDSAGNFYGTAQAGGANKAGVVWELVNN